MTKTKFRWIKNKHETGLSLIDFVNKCLVDDYKMLLKDGGVVTAYLRATNGGNDKILAVEVKDEKYQVIWHYIRMFEYVGSREFSEMESGRRNVISELRQHFDLAREFDPAWMQMHMRLNDAIEEVEIQKDIRRQNRGNSNNP